jgi:azurin
VLEICASLQQFVLFNCATCDNVSTTLRHTSEGSFRYVHFNYVIVPRRDEVTVDWRRLHNEEINDLYCSPNIVRVIKSRRMRWAGHVARIW